MMLSLSACRLGSFTTNRKGGASLVQRSIQGGRRAFLTQRPSINNQTSLLARAQKEPWTPRRLVGHCSSSFSTLSSSPSSVVPGKEGPRPRLKSTQALSAYDTEEEEDSLLDVRTKGFAAAAELRAIQQSTETSLSHEEAWMINLGRGDDNEWLTGPRAEEWFTGIHPRICPGK